MLARLVADLRQASLRDLVTGLPNRRAAEQALAAEARRSGRGAPPFSLLMIDADHFKSINDRHGHAAGDHARWPASVPRWRR